MARKRRDEAPTSFHWKPHPGPQTIALQRQEKEILFGGGRGSGKTDVGIIFMLLPAVQKDAHGNFSHPYYKGLVLRRHAEDLSDWVERADAIYRLYGGQRTGRPPTWRFPSGAVIRTGHLRDEDAFTKYQGHEYHRMCIEEVQLIPSVVLYEKLLASCRSIHANLSSQIILTANPGGPGTTWIRDRFIKLYGEDGTPLPHGTPYFDKKAGHWRIYIPATIDHNPTLRNDPGYMSYLDSLPSALRKAWRYGDWSAIEGQFLPEFRPNGPLDGEPEWANHVISPVHLEPWWHRSMSCDWGYDHPAAVHWYCMDPVGRIHVYRELYVRHLSAHELGVRIAKEAAQDLMNMPDPRMILSLDPAAWHRVDDGKTVAEHICDGINHALGKGVGILYGSDDRPIDDDVPRQGQMAIAVRQADNQRVAGWTAVREALRWRPLFPGEQQEEVLPKLQIWTVCPNLIDQLESLVFSETKPEDAEKINAVDGKGGDDAADSLRYGMMSFRTQQKSPPMQVYIAERLSKLNKKYNGNVDPTIAYMVAQHAEAAYRQNFQQAEPVSFSRLSSRRRKRPPLIN